MNKRKREDSKEPMNWKPPPKPKVAGVQNSLDSDEEDAEVDEDRYNVMNEEDFEGIDDEPVTTEVGYTAFNMKEELEEGRFDKEGHYIPNKDKEIKDYWLDNIDWVKIKVPTEGEKQSTSENTKKGLADSDSEDEADVLFDPTALYSQMLQYLNPGETVSQALCRLGKGKKRMTTAERWKRKKMNQNSDVPDTDENSEKITKLTELANEILTRTGNMDIYQDTYESIKNKCEKIENQQVELDMYADDFDTKEKAKIDVPGQLTETKVKQDDKVEVEQIVTWQLKWSQSEDADVSGPHTTKEMEAWAKEGYFKRGAWVRRTGQEGQFYSAARVDFEIYL